MNRYVLLLILAVLPGAVWGQETTFKSPPAAVQALVAAVQTDNQGQLLAILGPEASPLISSGDEVADREGREKFLSAYRTFSSLVLRSDGSVVLHLGKENWPFPIPLVKQAGDWHFDTKAGVDDILNRRIGANELNAAKVCEAYVSAQREYVTRDRNGDGIIEYASKMHSTPGRHDGLFWQTAAGEPVSPLGPLVAQAEAEGYPVDGHHVPYHGYHFHILKQQGEHAAGGAYNYVINGHMVAGFALVAWPDNYGVTGVMTFLVNQNGTIFHKDLGPTTSDTVKTMDSFDPDDSWKRL